MEQNQKGKMIPLREEIQLVDTWSLEDIYSTNEDWEKDFLTLKELFPSILSYQGLLNHSAEKLFEALVLQDQLMINVEKLHAFAHMRYDQDTTNSFYQSMQDRILSLYAQIAGATAFIVPEIIEINEQVILKFSDEKKELKLYKQFLEEISIQRAHVLSAKEEALLAKASEIMDASSKTFGLLNNADLVFPSIQDENGETIQVTQGRYTKLLENKSQQIRRDAFVSVYSTYTKLKNTFASTLNGNVKKQNFTAEIRSYQSAREASLARNNIPESVYEGLIETVHANLPLLHRYVKLRKEVLKLEELHIYDLYTPLLQDVEMEVSYEQAKELILKALKPMGQEYLGILEEGFNGRWVDVHENKGKRSGAYSSGSYLTKPYILMNWQGNVDNLFTLAHEFGHSVHSYYTRKNQPPVYGSYSIFVAEVASTCNEALLNHYLIETTNDERKRLYLLNHLLESFRGTLFRQTMFAEFEHIIHQKAQHDEPLTSELLSKEYYALNKLYFGDQHIILDEEIQMEWARVPHFYYNYYVFQYATGISAAVALSTQILTEGQPAVERYLSFLKAGCSDFPIEVLKKAGVDMTTTKPVEQACKVFEETLNEMERLLLKK